MPDTDEGMLRSRAAKVGNEKKCAAHEKANHREKGENAIKGAKVGCPVHPGDLGLPKIENEQELFRSERQN